MKSSEIRERCRGVSLDLIRSNDWVSLADGEFHKGDSGETPTGPYIKGCKDEKERCDCDRVYHCETCDKRWYVSCHRHDYGDEELREGVVAN